MTGYRLGIDVGGTNTDAVVLDADGEPVASTKTATTDDITGGIIDAFEAVLRGGVEAGDIEQVMLGTTACTNAVAEREGLTEVGVLRLGSPATEAVPPLVEWPEELVAAIGDNIAVLPGGHEYDGEPIAELDETATREAIRAFGDVDAFAVTAVFSPAQPDHERRVRQLVREEVGEQPSISLSHRVGTIGFIERENATILNAALTGVAERTADAFLAAMDRFDVDATLYFARNDGTLMDVLRATERPVFTIASGPANSVRGAAHLSGVENGIVVDVGGTTTDLGIIREGFPRESARPAEIGDVTANFSLPDIVSLPIGGGTVVEGDDGELTVGPESVGGELSSRARAFGGETTTLTDVEVAAGADIGSHDVELAPGFVERVRERVRAAVTGAVTKLRTGPESVPVVVVGGGSFLVPGELEGVSELHRPDHYDVANAVGVATAQVSGYSDRLYDLGEWSREAAVADATARATADAVDNGAVEESVRVLGVETVSMAYVPGEIVRVTVDVAGDLRAESNPEIMSTDSTTENREES